MATSLIEAQKYLRGLEYPASKAEIIDTAQEEGADDRIVAMLRDQLQDGMFDTPKDVSQALGGQ